jgi:hypothetical protein
MRKKMKTNKMTLVRYVSMLILGSYLILASCSTPPTQIGTIPADVSYKEFTLPFPENISFELPDNWDFWGNAGYLSPDDGKTYAGIRLVWIEEGRNVEEALYNEGSIVHERTTVMVGELETHRTIVEVTLISASTGEVISHTYEMIYAFPAPNGEMMAGAVFSASTREELEPLVPIAEHMVSSLQWGSED